MERKKRHKNDPLAQVAQEIALCTRCGLHKTRQKAVPGEGPVNARIMLIGEAPGREEDLQGRPFVGRSGRILDEILAEAGFRRKELFITSVVKCRPPNNRMPKNLEQETCLSSHTRRQMQIISPKIICLLGGVAAKALLGITRVSEKRGHIFEKEGYRFFLTYHPAAAGRSRAWYQGLSQDMKQLRKHLEGGLEI
jgi:uracil-DNA glycosylase family 4